MDHDLTGREVRFKLPPVLDRNLCAAHVDVLKLVQPGQLRQPGVGHLRVDQRKSPQSGETAQVFQAGVGDLRVVQNELLQIDETGQVLDSGVRNLRPLERK